MIYIYIYIKCIFIYIYKVVFNGLEGRGFEGFLVCN